VKTPLVGRAPQEHKFRGAKSAKADEDGAMKGFIAVAFLASLLFVTRPAEATEVGSSRTFGLGLGLGTATSLVGKYFLDSSSALDFGISFWRYRRGCWRDRRGILYCDDYGDTYRHGSFGLNADYLWEENLVRRRAKLDWHIGVGGRFWRFDDDYYYGDDRVAFAARMPIGLDLTFARPNFLEVYLEAVPSLYFVPQVDFGIEAFIGIRLYF
jgi:hypothetical protein